MPEYKLKLNECMQADWDDTYLKPVKIGFTDKIVWPTFNMVLFGEVKLNG